MRFGARRAQRETTSRHGVRRSRSIPVCDVSRDTVTAIDEAPRLSVAEQIVLLTLHARRARVRSWIRVVRHAEGFTSYRIALDRLIAAGLVERRGPLRRIRATASADVEGRTGRVLARIQDVSPLSDDDASLIVLLAACRALELSRADYMSARHRITSINRADRLPEPVDLVRDAFGVETLYELADKLLHPLYRYNFKPGEFDPGAGSWGSAVSGGHGHGH